MRLAQPTIVSHAKYRIPSASEGLLLPATARRGVKDDVMCLVVLPFVLNERKDSHFHLRATVHTFRGGDDKFDGCGVVHVFIAKIMERLVQELWGDVFHPELKIVLLRFQ